MKMVLIFISWMHLDLSNHNAVHAWQQFLVVQKLFRTDFNAGHSKGANTTAGGPNVPKLLTVVSSLFQKYLPMAIWKFPLGPERK